MNKRKHFLQLLISLIRGYLIFLVGAVILLLFLLALSVYFPESINIFFSLLIFAICFFIGGYLAEFTFSGNNIFHKWLYSITITLLIFLPSFLIEKLYREIFFLILFWATFLINILGCLIGEKFKKMK